MLLSGFLEATSVHGLRYLTGSQNLLARIVWSVCIAASFTVAGWVIYFNVLQWENSPASITRAQPMLVQVICNAAYSGIYQE